MAVRVSMPTPRPTKGVGVAWDHDGLDPRPRNVRAWDPEGGRLVASFRLARLGTLIVLARHHRGHTVTGTAKSWGSGTPCVLDSGFFARCPYAATCAVAVHIRPNHHRGPARQPRGNVAPATDTQGGGEPSPLATLTRSVLTLAPRAGLGVSRWTCFWRLKLSNALDSSTSLEQRCAPSRTSEPSTTPAGAEW